MEWTMPMPTAFARYVLPMADSLAKSLLHNLGVLAVSLVVGAIGVGLDHLLGLPRFAGMVAAVIGAGLLTAGFALRVWATWHFYQRRMRVIVLEPQSDLVTDGPFRFSRNPLYLGGNVFMFLGAALALGSTGGVVLTAIGLIPTDRMIRREERQLEARFGDAWRTYAARVRRWL
jgi:protein-S-isoprenylcysteine O-methyltransferase Ste14